MCHFKICIRVLFVRNDKDIVMEKGIGEKGMVHPKEIQRKKKKHKQCQNSMRKLINGEFY